jgi:hypothetical protein
MDSNGDSVCRTAHDAVEHGLVVVVMILTAVKAYSQAASQK